MVRIQQSRPADLTMVPSANGRLGYHPGQGPVRTALIAKWVALARTSVSHTTPARNATKSNGKPLTSWNSVFAFPASLLRGRAALLDGISFSVIDFWEVHCSSVGAN